MTKETTLNLIYEWQNLIVNLPRRESEASPTTTEAAVAPNHPSPDTPHTAKFPSRLTQGWSHNTLATRFLPARYIPSSDTEISLATSSLTVP